MKPSISDEECALALFDTFIDLAPAAREDALRKLASTAPSTHKVLVGLLAASQNKDTWIDQPAADWSHSVHSQDPSSDSVVGTRLGPWLLEAAVGEGGMGRVYRARRDDGHYTQVVALKRIRAELVSHALTSAFLREREILAKLSHPNICRLIDGGIDGEGLPWLAMSWVEGESIVRWCDLQRLSVRQRVVLFLEVCNALGYAHQQMVLHRDLKPSNIMVSADGHISLLDFGVGTLLTSVDAAQNEPFAWSQEYSAPETLTGESVGAAADIYSLGRVLHRLLTGTSGAASNPLIALLMADRTRQAFSLSEIAADASQETAAARSERDPAALAKTLDRELNAIVGKCLQHAPQRRYESVAALRNDLENWCNQRPVAAIGGGAVYRMSRFLRRHRMLMAISMCLGGAAISGGVLTLHQRQVAQREAEASRVLSELFEDTLNLSTLSGLSQAPLTSRELLNRVEVRLRKRLLPNDPLVAARGLNTLSRSFAVTGDYRHALDLATEARQLALENNRLRSTTEATLASLLNQQARYKEAEGVARSSLTKVDRADASDVSVRLNLQAEIARARWGEADQDGAIRELQHALDAAALLGSDADKVRAELLTLRGYWRTQQFRAAEAANDLEHAIALSYKSAPMVADNARQRLVRAYALLDRPKDAFATAQTLLENRRSMYGDNHPETGRALTTYASALIYNADLKRALEYVTKAKDVLHRTVGDDHPDMAEALRFSAYIRTGSGDAAGAISEAREALRIQLKVHGSRHELTLKAKANLASELFYLGQYDIAKQQAYFEESRKLFTDVLAESDHQNLPMPDTRLAYANGLVIMKRLEDAEQQLLLANREITEHLGRQHSYLAHTQYSLGLLYLEKEKYDLAEGQFKELVANFRAIPEAPYTRSMTAFGALDSLGNIEHERGHRELALGYWNQALELGSKVYGADDSTLKGIRQKLKEN